MILEEESSGIKGKRRYDSIGKRIHLCPVLIDGGTVTAFAITIVCVSGNIPIPFYTGSERDLVESQFHKKGSVETECGETTAEFFPPLVLYRWVESNDISVRIKKVLNIFLTEIIPQQVNSHLESHC